MKKIASLILSLVFVIGSCFFVPGSQVIAYAASQPWDSQIAAGIKADFSVDTAQKSDDAKYSIKITNKEYGLSRVEKEFKVKPNTMYRASVMAKCGSYNPSPNPKFSYGRYGAALSKSGELPNAASYTGKIWSELSYCFNSGDSKSVKLSLYNAENKGTVYFSNFKLEEITQDSNKWNLCVVFFKNIKAPIVQDGKKTTLKSKLSQEDIDYCTGQISQLYSLMSRMSEGRMDVKSIDFYECDKTITSLTGVSGNYSLNRNDKVYKETLDTIIANAEKNSGKRYDQFVILSPLTTDIAGKYGVGDILYQNIHLCQVYINPSENMKTVAATCIHEILHSVEGISTRMDPNTVELHAVDDEYLEYYHAWANGLPGNGTWFSDYMRKATHDGRGLNENSFYTHGKLIYSNGKTVKSSTKTTYKTPDVGVLKISAISTEHIPAKR